MTVTAPLTYSASLASSKPSGAQQSPRQLHSAQSSQPPKPDLVAASQLPSHTDLVAIQLSELNNMLLSLGQHNPNNFARAGAKPAVGPVEGRSSMDFYA